MKFFVVFVILFLSSCANTSSLNEETCQQNYDILPIEDNKVCMNSIRCISKNKLYFNNYICFCDNFCLCFFSTLTDCKNIEDENCKKSGFMTFAGNNFCNEPNKFDFLEDLFNKTKETLFPSETKE